MKITLSEPPEGFEAEAEYRTISGWEWTLSDLSGKPYHVSYSPTRLIVLTPKKRKFWRLDPVATFEEATPTCDKRYRYCFVDEVLTSLAYSAPVQWLKLSEHEE